MRLTTIWTLPDMATTERLRRTRDLFVIYTLPRWLPKRLRFGVLITEGARYSVQVKPDVVVPEMTYMEVLADVGNRVGS